MTSNNDFNSPSPLAATRANSSTSANLPTGSDSDHLLNPEFFLT